MHKEINADEIILSVLEKILKNLETNMYAYLKNGYHPGNGTTRTINLIKELKNGLPESAKRIHNYTHSNPIRIDENAFVYPEREFADGGKGSLANQFISLVKNYYSAKEDFIKLELLEKIIKHNKIWTVFNGTGFFDKLSKEFTSPQKLIQKEFGRVK